MELVDKTILPELVRSPGWAALLDMTPSVPSSAIDGQISQRKYDESVTVGAPSPPSSPLGRRHGAPNLLLRQRTRWKVGVLQKIPPVVPPRDHQKVELP